jgi:hypothetical protein
MDRLRKSNPPQADRVQSITDATQATLQRLLARREAEPAEALAESEQAAGTDSKPTKPDKPYPEFPLRWQSSLVGGVQSKRKAREEVGLMAHPRCRPRPTQATTLTPLCPEGGHSLRAASSNYRTVTTQNAVTRLTLHVRGCPNPDCSRYHRPYRPEAESLLALPDHEFGLDVLALGGRLRHAERTRPRVVIA